MMFFSRAGLVLLSFFVMASSVIAHPQGQQTIHVHRRQNNNKLVFAHFMIGIVADRKSAGAYDADMKRAKSYGIDAFALNIGVDSYTDDQLQYAYASAANNGMKVFISFDFNWWSTSDATAVGQKIAKYGSLPGQLMVDGKIFASSFIGDGLDVAQMRAAAGSPVYWAPNFTPYSSTGVGSCDAALNWMGWPSNGANRAPTAAQNVAVSVGDQAYMSHLGSKDYIAPASPWFFTHYGSEVSYSKNWLFPGELLWYKRWNQLLTMGNRFVEIVSWNDYGESHYVGPLSSPHMDDGASKWVNDMPHNGFLDMAKPFIAAFKAGATSPNSYITSDQVVYWYRPHLKGVNVDSTDNCGSAPAGVDTVTDSIFVVTLLKSAATLTVTSGGQTHTYDAPAGAASYAVPMGVGQQKFSISRGGQSILSGTSAKEVVNTGVCGMYNFNAYVGTLPANFNDALQADGISQFTRGLKSNVCAATPSLGTFAAADTGVPDSGPTATDDSPSSSGVTSAARFNAAATTLATATVSATPTPTPATTGCTAGVGNGNYQGLCDFSCRFGYCPSPCSCTATGNTASAPARQVSISGKPAPGLDDSYSGLCAYACSHGYCPGAACVPVVA